MVPQKAVLVYQSGLECDSETLRKLAVILGYVRPSPPLPFFGTKVKE